MTANESNVTGNERLPWDGQPYSIKRHGVSITNCDSEPVQTPGCVQGHGALLVLRVSSLTVLQASENCHVLLGQPADKLLGQSVAAAIGAEGEVRLREFFGREATDRNPLYVLTLPRGVKLRPWMSPHTRLTAWPWSSLKQRAEPRLASLIIMRWSKRRSPICKLRRHYNAFATSLPKR